MYNGIGLTTPRGSGTNGYVVRNLSALRVHDTAADRANAWDMAPPKHREPDEAILEHERKRKVEIKCLELQLQLEDEGMREDKIEEQVGALRAKLLENLSTFAPVGKNIRSSDTHALAAAKKVELSRMARALGTRNDYKEGEAFDPVKQEENKMRRIAEREERERKKEEEKAKMQAQKAKWEADRKERDRLRDENRLRREKEEAERKKAKTPPPPPSRERERTRDEGNNRKPYRGGDRRSRSRTPPRRGFSPRERDRDRRGPSPPRSRPFSARSLSYSRQRSPPARFRRRSPSRSRTPPPSSRRDRSPPPTTHYRTRDRSPPPLRRARSRSRSRSPRRFVEPLPPQQLEKKGDDESGCRRSQSPRGGRSRSVSTSSSMSVSTRSGGSRSRSRSRSGSN